MLMKHWQTWSGGEKFVSAALLLGVLVSGVAWFAPRVVAPSIRMPGDALNAVTPHQKGAAAIVPTAATRPCADARRGAAGRDAGTDTREEGRDDVRLLAARGLAVPVAGIEKGKLYDSFDDGRGAGKHEALDIHAPRGTPVIAAGDGCVVKLFRSIPGGLTLYQFDPEGNFAYYYAHLERYADEVKEGSQVRRGDVLGYVGTSGNAPANSPHLHFAIFRLGPEKRWWKGTAVNPYAVLTHP